MTMVDITTIIITLEGITIMADIKKIIKNIITTKKMKMTIIINQMKTMKIILKK